MASRAKYQFPDVYVHYQDLCRRGQLRLGQPRLYKREGSFDYELADEPESLTHGNAETWFLLYPTKQHWRQRASLKGIREGLEWLEENYEKEGSKSLAVPALGCGLGGLKWAEVGPVLCQTLARLSIQAMVYLPAEKRVPEKQLTSEFLLS